MLSNVETELLERIACALELIAEHTSPLFASVARERQKAEEKAAEKEAEDKHARYVESISLEELGLSNRMRNCLQANYISTVRDLLRFNKLELSKMRHVGLVSINQLLESLENLGLELPVDSEMPLRQWIKEHE